HSNNFRDEILFPIDRAGLIGVRRRPNSIRNLQRPALHLNTRPCLIRQQSHRVEKYFGNPSIKFALKHSPDSSFPHTSRLYVKTTLPRQSVPGKNYPKSSCTPGSQKGMATRKRWGKITVRRALTRLHGGPSIRLVTPSCVGNAIVSFVRQYHLCAK